MSFVDQITHINRATISALRYWLATHPTTGVKYIYTVDNARPADIADPINILWNYGYSITSGDALDDFIRDDLDIPLPALDTLDALI